MSVSDPLAAGTGRPAGATFSHRATRPGPPGDTDDGVADYLRRLHRSLRGPGPAKADLLREVRDGLHDAVEAYRRDGLSVAQAQRRALDEFGAVELLAPGLQDELTTGAIRALALRTALGFTAVAGGSVLMWWGAPWTGTEPPAAYLLLSAWVDRLGYALVACALAAYLWLAWTLRHGRPPSRDAARLVGGGAALLLAGTAVGGALLYGWSLRLFSSAATWPPMLLGSILILAVYGWLGRATWHCLATGRR